MATKFGKEDAKKKREEGKKVIAVGGGQFEESAGFAKRATERKRGGGGGVVTRDVERKEVGRVTGAEAAEVNRLLKRGGIPSSENVRKELERRIGGAGAARQKQEAEAERVKGLVEPLAELAGLGEAEELPPETLPGVTEEAGVEREAPGIGDLLSGRGFEQLAEEEGGQLAAGTIPLGGAAGIGKIVKAGAGKTIPLSNEAVTKVAGLKKVFSNLKGKSSLIGTSAARGLANAHKFAFGIGLGAVGAAAAGELGAVFTKRFTAEDRRIKSIETDVGIMSEAIPTYSALVQAGGSPEDSLEALNDFEDDLDTYEQTIKLLELGSDELKTNPEFTAALKRRIPKQRTKIETAKRIILIHAANPQDPRLEQLGELLSSLE